MRDPRQRLREGDYDLQTNHLDSSQDEDGEDDVFLNINRFLEEEKVHSIDLSSYIDDV